MKNTTLSLLVSTQTKLLCALSFVVHVARIIILVL